MGEPSWPNIEALKDKVDSSGVVCIASRAVSVYSILLARTSSAIYHASQAGMQCATCKQDRTIYISEICKTPCLPVSEDEEEEDEEACSAC